MDFDQQRFTKEKTAIKTRSYLEQYFKNYHAAFCQLRIFSTEPNTKAFGIHCAQILRKMPIMEDQAFNLYTSHVEANEKQKDLTEIINDYYYNLLLLSKLIVKIERDYMIRLLGEKEGKSLYEKSGIAFKYCQEGVALV